MIRFVKSYITLNNLIKKSITNEKLHKPPDKQIKLM
jgi:hypothetical protein